MLWQFAVQMLLSVVTVSSLLRGGEKGVKYVADPSSWQSATLVWWQSGAGDIAGR